MLASNSHLNMTKNKDDFDDDKDDVDQDKSYVGVADERLTKGLRNLSTPPTVLLPVHKISHHCKVWMRA